MLKQPNILRLNSREYKTILKVNNFLDIEKGRKKINEKLKNCIEKQKGKFKVNDSNAERKRVWYLDTSNHELNTKYNFLLRVREEYYDKSDNIKGYDITFKNRNSDRLKAASFDLSEFDEQNPFKFKVNLKKILSPLLKVSFQFLLNLNQRDIRILTLTRM